MILAEGRSRPAMSSQSCLEISTMEPMSFCTVFDDSRVEATAMISSAAASRYWSATAVPHVFRSCEGGLCDVTAPSTGNLVTSVTGLDRDRGRTILDEGLIDLVVLVVESGDDRVLRGVLGRNDEGGARKDSGGKGKE